MYQGAVRELEEVTKSLDSIGPEVIQTLSVSTIQSLLHRCLKSHSIMICVFLGFSLVNVLQLDEPIRADKLTLGRVTRFPALFIDCLLSCVKYQFHVFPRLLSIACFNLM